MGNLMYKCGILSKGILQLVLFHQGANYRFMFTDYIHCLDWGVYVVDEIPPTVRLYQSVHLVLGLIGRESL